MWPAQNFFLVGRNFFRFERNFYTRPKFFYILKINSIHFLAIGFVETEKNMLAGNQFFTIVSEWKIVRSYTKHIYPKFWSWTFTTARSWCRYVRYGCENSSRSLMDFKYAIITCTLVSLLVLSLVQLYLCKLFYLTGTVVDYAVHYCIYSRFNI